ncbi:hypothetical protein R11007_02872 [Ralstonia holmesii]|nr:hypothetical protein R11007_02872 [Ralstonia sp. LMG 32967]
MTTEHQTREPLPAPGPGEHVGQINPTVAAAFLAALHRRRGSLRTCLSCGAKGLKDHQLPCGH